MPEPDGMKVVLPVLRVIRTVKGLRLRDNVSSSPTIHIGVCAVYLHKSSAKFTNLFVGSP